MRSITLPLAALALSACATVPAAAPIRSDGLAHLGEATRVGSLVVTPRAIVEDSRCPINVTCVWAGRAVVRTEVVGPRWREMRNLVLGERVATHGTTLTLISIEPRKMTGVQLPFARQTLGFDGGR